MKNPYVQGWVEVDEYGDIAIGRLGLRVYRYKKDILAEGFHPSEVMKVVIKRSVIYS